MSSSAKKKKLFSGPLPVTIKVTKTDIEYEEGRAEKTGYLTIGPGDPAMSSSDAASILHLLFYLVYTQEGRSLLLDNAFDRDATNNLPPGTTRARLKAALRARFPELEDARLEIALDAHFAAGEYAAADKQGDHVTMQRQQDIYKQKLTATLGALYDDSMSRDFSFVW